jgi:hypothetical protein
MKKAVPVLVGVVIGVLAVFLGLKLQVIKWGGGGLTNLPTPMCDALVKISLEKDATGNLKIAATPDPVCLAIGRPLNWEIKDQPEADKAVITIKFKPQNNILSPFPRDLTNSDNTGEGVYEHTGPGKVNSNKATHNDRWTYSVEWKIFDGPTIKTPDPVVCIRD